MESQPFQFQCLSASSSSKVTSDPTQIKFRREDSYRNVAAASACIDVKSLKFQNLGLTVFDNAADCTLISAFQLWGDERQEKSFIWKHCLSSIHSSRMRETASNMKGVFILEYIKVRCILPSSVFFLLLLQNHVEKRKGNCCRSHRGKDRKKEINKEC